MDIRFVISKSILYFFLVLFVALSFTFVTFSTAQFFEGQGQVAVTLIVSLIVVIFLDPLKKLLAKLTDKFFYKGKIDYQAVLRLIGEGVARELDLAPLLKMLSENLEKELKLKSVSILIIKDVKEKKFRTLNSEKSMILEPDDLIARQLEKTRELIITEELARRRSESKAPEQIKFLEDLEHRLDELKIGLAVPILVEDRLTGFFLIEGKMSGSAFTQEDINFFEVLSPQVATALEKSKLFEQVQSAKANLEVLVEQRTADLKERNQYLTALQTLINLITRSLDFQKVMQTIADGIASELGFIGGLLSFINPEKNAIQVGAITNTPLTKKVLALVPLDPRRYAVSLNDEENLGVKAIKTQEIVSSGRFYDFLKPALPEVLVNTIQKVLGAKSILAVPVYSEEHVIGVIDFILAKAAEKVTDVEKEMMKSLADQVGIVYRNISLYDQIKKTNDQLKDANIHLTKLDQAKSEFLSIASHQLRTPLTGIKGYLSMIMEGDYGPVPQKVKSVVEEVFTNSDRLTRMVNIFLNVSRIESGKFEMAKKDTDLVQLILGTVKTMKLPAEQRKLELIFHQPKKLIPHLQLDQEKIQDVLLNLIDNAIKYTPKGKIEIFVEVIGKAIQVMIKDTGIGIPKGEDRELFKKFVRGEGVAQINTGGSGLGLFIVKKIIEAHNGKVWVESAGKGMGSSFIFTLPMS